MLARGREFLLRKGIEGGRREAELLVAHALGLDRLQLFLALERPVQPVEIERARALLGRRAAHEPVAYLTGRREFYGRSFQVDARVLIPRPETELLIDLARDWHKQSGVESPRVLDVGTGSGCVAISAALELKGSRVWAVDVSAEALAVARANAERLLQKHPEAGLEFVEADGPEGLDPDLRFELVLSNPPYVTPEEGAELAPHVREHEPSLALFAPDGDPDHWLRRLAQFAAARLVPGGRFCCELGASQGSRALAVAAEAGLTGSLRKDLAGIPRVLDAALAD